MLDAVSELRGMVNILDSKTKYRNRQGKIMREYMSTSLRHKCSHNFSDGCHKCIIKEKTKKGRQLRKCFSLLVLQNDVPLARIDFDLTPTYKLILYQYSILFLGKMFLCSVNDKHPSPRYKLVTDTYYSLQ